MQSRHEMVRVPLFGEPCRCDPASVYFWQLCFSARGTRQGQRWTAARLCHRTSMHSQAPRSDSLQWQRRVTTNNDPKAHPSRLSSRFHNPTLSYCHRLCEFVAFHASCFVSCFSCPMRLTRSNVGTQHARHYLHAFPHPLPFFTSIVPQNVRCCHWPGSPAT
ncbi:hypothetical protein LZ31DRAFT_40087 [Colletotrichum somersetense]|nr:hypothetical protein LZ31DRAFT_40087 [Colletotrichum somersetense]